MYRHTWIKVTKYTNLVIITINIFNSKYDNNSNNSLLYSKMF